MLSIWAWCPPSCWTSPSAQLICQLILCQNIMPEYDEAFYTVDKYFSRVRNNLTSLAYIRYWNHTVSWSRLYHRCNLFRNILAFRSNKFPSRSKFEKRIVSSPLQMMIQNSTGAWYTYIYTAKKMPFPTKGTEKDHSSATRETDVGFATSQKKLTYLASPNQSRC